MPMPRNLAWVTAASLSDCADEVATLLVDRDTRDRLENAAFAYGDQHLSERRLLAEMRAMLPTSPSARIAGWTIGPAAGRRAAPPIR